MGIESGPETGLDELMHAIRTEIDRSKSIPVEAGQPIGADAQVGTPPRSVLPSTGVAPAPSVGTRRKTIAQRLDVRILLQRLLGVRQVVKLGNQLEPLRHGPVPLQGLPGAVNELRRSVSELDRLKLQTAEAAARAKKMEERVGADLAAANVGIADLSSRYEALKQVNARIADLSSRYEALPQDLAARLEGLERIIDSLASSINILHDTTARILRRAADQGRRLDLLIAEARSRLPEPLAREQIETFEEVGRDRLAALYVDFEDRFRGDRPDIAGRQSIYLSHIRDAAELTGLKTFLDIGCGRGEFLELLKNAGLEPRGVDSNAVMVAACCDLGLEATKADGVSHLRGLPDGQLAGVSGFHIIEHISYDALIALIDAALGALAPGGVLILETPNPANLLVAAERFYFDPTHRNPLPSEMMAFMVEARGFVDVEIVPLHPVDHLQRRYEDPMLALLQEKLYGPQDYGVVARKPR